MLDRTADAAATTDPLAGPRTTRSSAPMQPEPERTPRGGDLDAVAGDGPTVVGAVLRQLQAGAGNAAVSRAAQIQRAGQRRRGTEHTSGARPSTAHDHSVGKSRKRAQEAAADERNEVAAAAGEEHDRLSVLAEVYTRLRNLPDRIRTTIRAAGAHGVVILRDELGQRRGYDLDAELADVGLEPEDLEAFLRERDAIVD